MTRAWARVFLRTSSERNARGVHSARAAPRSSLALVRRTALVRPWFHCLLGISRRNKRLSFFGAWHGRCDAKAKSFLTRGEPMKRRSLVKALALAASIAAIGM